MFHFIYQQREKRELYQCNRRQTRKENKKNQEHVDQNQKIRNAFK